MMSGMENPTLGWDLCHFTEVVTVLEPPVSMQEIVFFSGENPGVFTNGGCYLQWIARQYGMVADNTETECDQEIGDINDKDKTDWARSVILIVSILLRHFTLFSLLIQRTWTHSMILAIWFSTNVF